MKKTENTVEVIVTRPFCVGYGQVRFEPGKTYKFKPDVAQNIVARGLGKLKAAEAEEKATAEK